MNFWQVRGGVFSREINETSKLYFKKREIFGDVVSYAVVLLVRPLEIILGCMRPMN